MARVHSHYEDLKVARDAPLEVIRAAYRSLSQKYHPDRNPGDADAARVMTTLNTAYGVLSDPEQRREHDRWIAHAEASAPQPQSTPSPVGATGKDHPDARASPRRKPGALAHVLRHWFLYGVAILAAASGVNHLLNRAQAPQPYMATPPTGDGPTIVEAPPADRPVFYKRSPRAPNGAAWPPGAAYVPGYPVLRNKGHATLTIDNLRNDSDVFAKLVFLGAPRAYPVRTFFVPAHAQFKLADVSAGTYDLRYRNLDGGRLWRLDPFTIEEAGKSDSAIEVGLPLYETANAKRVGLAEEQF